MLRTTLCHEYFTPHARPLPQERENPPPRVEPAPAFRPSAVFSREPPTSGDRQFDFKIIPARALAVPSPEGEGQGEGERHTDFFANHQPPRRDAAEVLEMIFSAAIPPLRLNHRRALRKNPLELGPLKTKLPA